MTNEKEWPNVLGAVARGWCHDANSNKVMDEDLAIAIAKEIMPLVAEATRRGEVKAWEEAKMILVPHQQFAADHPYREVRKKLFKAVEDKLTSLKTS